MEFSWESQGGKQRLDIRFECDETGRTVLHDLKTGNSQTFDSYDEAISYLGQQQPQSQN